MKKINIAIVGVGPRGLSALESLISELAKHTTSAPFHVLLFEQSQQPGNGPVYDLNQPESNWLNVSERILLLEGRPAVTINHQLIPSFPSYHEWAGLGYLLNDETKVDYFPPRSKLGKYLNERFRTIYLPLQRAALANLIGEQVIALESQSNQLQVTTESGDQYSVDQVVLTIGHQPTELDDQLQEWTQYVNKNDSCTLFTDPYPVVQYLDHPKLSSDIKIALRGFGLAMMDVVRNIALKFGKFETDPNDDKLKFLPQENIKDLFIPFSLDGLPMSAKPFNAAIDNQFKPTKEELSQFEKIIGDRSTQKHAKSPLFLIKAITPIIERVFLSLIDESSANLKNNSIQEISLQWLQDDDYQHPLIISKDRSPLETMNDFVAMAKGTRVPSLDFTIGQVWRHCEPTMYDELSFNQCDDDVFAEIIDLDERMKRYAYGPPVESLQQLIALTDAAVMNLEVVNNPEIELTEDGWQLCKNERCITTTMMINSVIDPPKLLAVDTPLIKKLLGKGLIQPVHSKLGVETDQNGYIQIDSTDNAPEIALLGRLAKGTIMGVDAILECFGKRPENWARECVRRSFCK